jgi:hypothetical protein
MLTWIKAPKDFLAGVIFLLVGGVFFFWSREYQMGTATRMGPGYFPALLAIVLCLFGIGAIIKGVLAKTPDPLPNHSILPLFFMVGAVFSFGLLIGRAGFVVASAVSLVLACYQRWRTAPLEIVALFVCLTLFNYTVFIYFFGMPMKVFWWD